MQLEVPQKLQLIGNIFSISTGNDAVHNVMSKTSKILSTWQARELWELFTKLRQIPIIEILAAARISIFRIILSSCYLPQPWELQCPCHESKWLLGHFILLRHSLGSWCLFGWVMISWMLVWGLLVKYEWGHICWNAVSGVMVSLNFKCVLELVLPWLWLRVRWSQKLSRV